MISSVERGGYTNEFSQSPVKKSKHVSLLDLLAHCQIVKRKSKKGNASKHIRIYALDTP